MVDTFLKRDDMVAWATQQDKKTFLSYFKNVLQERKTRKNLKFTPCNVELRTCVNLPSISLYNQIVKLNNYYEWCSKELNLIKRFDDIKPHTALDKKNQKYSIVVDTREQLPLFHGNTLVSNEKLDYGDYKIFNNVKEVYFERKSIVDFIGTLSSGLSRFKNELDRARENNHYLVICVEGLLSSCMTFNKSSFIYSKIRVTPQYIFRHVRDLLQEYHNIQFVFVKNRDVMEKFMIDVFNLTEDYTKIDLQFAYDAKLI